MVAGMTPTTVKAGFFSAVLEVGYHVELAGSGHYSPAALHAKVAEIQGKISHGMGLTLNSIHQPTSVLLPAPAMARDVTCAASPA